MVAFRADLRVFPVVVVSTLCDVHTFVPTVMTSGVAYACKGDNNDRKLVEGSLGKLAASVIVFLKIYGEQGKCCPHNVIIHSVLFIEIYWVGIGPTIGNEGSYSIALTSANDLSEATNGITRICAGRTSCTYYSCNRARISCR